jgi:hypothetical protein
LNRMGEEWIIAKGYRNKYEVSNYGRVRNYKTREMKTQGWSTDKYPIVRLYDGGLRPSSVKLHRLVAECWLKDEIDRFEGKWYVGHKNGDKSDNTVGNLVVCGLTELRMLTERNKRRGLLL